MPEETALPLTERSAAALEFPTFLRLLAELTATDVGRERLLALLPLPSQALLERQRRRFTEADRLLGDGALVPALEEPLGTLLDRLARADRSVAGGDLLLVAALLDAGRRAAERIRDGEGVPALQERAARLPDGEALRRKIVAVLDRRGRVRDGATPRLASLRRKVRGLREALYQNLEGVRGLYREHLAEETIPLKEGRLVLLLHAGARGRVKGLVHGRSGSGRSVYFEPLEVVEPNNRLQETLEEEDAERRRILTELVDEALAARATIEGHVEFLADLDLLQAASRFAGRAGARLAEIAGDGELCLREARHPLLDPALLDLREQALGTAGHAGPVTPLDLELLPERRILVVTGPNAGGKTVALKTVGLLTLAHLCALPVPAAAGSRLPFLRGVTATVGDEQDLLADRSTFSGRLLRWREAWDTAGPDRLVLLDELGSGTDPEEGSALSVALLEGLLERGALAVITTHLSRLAAAALEQPGAFCGAMEFDAASGLPTYRLRPGAPGASEALALATRLGLPRPWLTRAEELLGTEHRDLRQALAEVERVRQELAVEQGRLEGERRQAEQLRREADAELAAARQERRSVASRLRREVEAFRRKVTERLRGEVERLRAELEGGRRRGLAAAAVERLFEEVPPLGEAEEEETVELPVAVGGRVRHRGLGWEGRVEKLQGDVAEVNVQGKRLRTRTGELIGLAEGDAAEIGAETPPPVRFTEEDTQTETEPELNLIGWRVEPALAALDSYLDRALLSSRREVRVVHGFGTGRLRRAVRDYLRPHPAVAEFRAGGAREGGEGATVVVLRGA